MGLLRLQNDATANGSTDATTWPGGVGTFHSFGTHDGETNTLQVSLDGGTTYIAVGTDTTLTADGIGTFELPKGAKIRATLSSAGASTSISSWLGSSD